MAVMCCAALLGACNLRAEGPSPDVVVGVGSTTEQRVLAALAVVALEGRGITASVEEVQGGTRELRALANRGAIDLFWDYTGAAWVRGLRQEVPPAADPVESYQRVAEEDRENGLTWLAPTTADATLALFVDADRLPDGGSLTGLSAELAEGGTLCIDSDFVDGPGGLRALAEVYAIDLDAVEVRRQSEEAAITAVASGSCRAGLATATSGVARNQRLVPLTDDLRVFPAFIVAPVARTAALERVPAVADAIAPLAELLDTARLAELNAQVEAGADPRALAETTLAANGLPTTPPEGDT